MGRLTGRKAANAKLPYAGNHISLGRRDGILQMVDDGARAKPKCMGGREAVRIKAGLLGISLWGVSHPAFGLPRRKRRLAAAETPALQRAMCSTSMKLDERRDRFPGQLLEAPVSTAEPWRSWASAPARRASG
ncbi:hypothetical protein [Streptomyces altiplanensis]